MTACMTCFDGGYVLRFDGKQATWEPCSCAAGKAFAAEIRKGREDIKAGRLTRWADIRREVTP